MSFITVCPVGGDATEQQNRCDSEHEQWMASVFLFPLVSKVYKLDNCHLILRQSSSLLTF